MKFFIFFIGFLLVAFFSNSQISFEDGEKVMLLTEHNTKRKIMGAKKIFWSDTLEMYANITAQNIAEKPFNYEIENSYGCNIYRCSYKPTAKEIVNYWSKEQRYYLGGEVTEDGLKLYSHYTQIIWKQTASVGCAISQTEGGTYIIVCLYNPKGNILGQKP
jgi:uncharacterized protein YkwD